MNGMEIGGIERRVNVTGEEKMGMKGTVVWMGKMCRKRELESD